MKPYMKAQKVNYPEWYRAYSAGMESEWPDYSKLDAQYGLYKKLSSLYTALDVVGKIGAPVKHKVKQRKGEELIDIDNHAWEQLLDRPNPINSGYAFIKNTIKYLMLGRAFWWLNATSDKAAPSEIWVIPSNRIAPVADGNMGIKGYRYDPGLGSPLLLPPEQIVMFGDTDLTSPLLPFSPVETVAMVAEGDLQMQRWNTQLFKGNARLPGVMTFADMIGNDQWDELQKSVTANAEKRNIMLLRGTGSGAVNWIQGDNAPKDLEFIAGRKENRNEIWNTFAQGLVSMLSENATEANARTGKATLIDLVVYPLLQYIDSEVTAKIMPRYGEGLTVEPDDIRVTDRVLELSEITEFSKTHTVDEVRKKYWNDDPLANGEVGVLLVAKAQTAQTVEAEPEQPQMPVATGNPLNDIEQQEEQVTQKADPRSAILELEKWERVAKKSARKAEGFESYNIPAVIADGIKSELVKCASGAAVKILFDNARDNVKAQLGDPIPANDAAAVLEGIRLALGKP